MPQFEVQEIDELDTRIIRVTQHVLTSDLIRVFEREMDARVMKNVIWEFLPSVLERLDTDELKRYIAARRTNIERREGGKSIMVAYEMTEVLPVTWYKSFVENLSFHDVSFHIVRSMDAALDILDPDGNFDGSLRQASGL